jgi:hypothetical protein
MLADNTPVNATPHIATLEEYGNSKINIIARVPEIPGCYYDYSIKMSKEEMSKPKLAESIDEYVHRNWLVNYDKLSASLQQLRKEPTRKHTTGNARSLTNVFLRHIQRVEYTVGIWLIHLSQVSEYWDLPPREWAKYKEGETLPEELWGKLCENQHVEIEVELNIHLLDPITGKPVVDQKMMQTFEEMAKEMLYLLTAINMKVSMLIEKAPQ